MTTATGFVGWFAQYGQMMYVFVQMAFWVVLAGAAVVAVRRYSDYVKHMTGESRSAEDIVRDSLQAEFMAAVRQGSPKQGEPQAAADEEPTGAE
ncbi:hypothetical protein [Anaerosoma tenue]|uniref:hypothetical protein n=1 Tax=Anaerosoma tenue TaxID=2933588 RepID=UPI002260885F|nr:hypothetical protein [Anaerosoma tenue]MCK8114701.1 hypothetical protein [Anaerosoma tenue]